MFDNCKTHTKQGDLGEARAIYEYTKMGYIVSKPLCDSAKYDIIVDDEITLKRVQVKTSQCVSGTGNGKAYSINLVTSGGNTSTNTRRKPEDGDYDELFVLTEMDECWMIPSEHTVGKSMIVVGNTKYNEYKI